MSSPPHWAISYCNHLTFRLSFSHFWSCTRSPVTISISDKSRGSVLWLHEFSAYSKLCQIEVNINAYLPFHTSIKHWVAYIPSIFTSMLQPKEEDWVNPCSSKLLTATSPSNLFQFIYICLFPKPGECFCISTLDTAGQSWQALIFVQGGNKISSLGSQFSEYSQILTEMLLLSIYYFQAPPNFRLNTYIFSWFFLAGSCCNCFSFCKALGSLSRSFKSSFIKSWMLSHSVSCTIISSLKNRPQFPFLDSRTHWQCQHWHFSCWEISQYLGFWEMSIRYRTDEICEFTAAAERGSKRFCSHSSKSLSR